MKKINVTIPNMQSSHCMNQVKNAVSDIDGVQIEKLSPGTLGFSVEQAHTEDAVLEAIFYAGYTVSSDLKGTSCNCHSACCSN
ncbi:MAG: heavy-metal-associated domain-containing protein [Bacteroidia bacterium]